MNRYALALLLLALAVVPLFYISGWLSVAAFVAIYGLLTRLANNDFDRRSGRGSRLHPDALRRMNPPQKSSCAAGVESRHVLNSRNRQASFPI